MEVAHSLPFYDTMRLYSLINNFDERTFKYEVWLCHEYMKMGFEEIFNTPTSDRKEYIKIHNKVANKQKTNNGG